MPGGHRRVIPALITSAQVSKSLDADQRNRRYLASMAVRVICFVSGCIAPWPYNMALMIGAAVIPGVAVVLANAIDLRTPPTDAPGAPIGTPALTAGIVVSGDVDEPRGTTA